MILPSAAKLARLTKLSLNNAHLPAGHLIPL